MNKYLFALALAAGLMAGHSSAHAQSFYCPQGYTCVPAATRPVNCPFGYTCRPVNFNPYPTYPQYPTNPPTSAGSLRIVSPNGGEMLKTGTSRAIQWTSPAYFRATYADIKLIRYSAPCTSYICPMTAASMMTVAPYTIASNTNINANSFAWIVGQVTTGNPYNTGSYITVPDGQYTVQICETGTSNCDSSDSPFTIYSGSNPNPTGQTPVISGVDAPTTLTVGQTGTWTVHAADPQNGILNYSVDWGDTAQPIYGAASMSASGQFTQTTSFTHAYNTTGTFTITFTVRNNTGMTAQSKTTVYVGSTGTSNQPIKVTSPNGGEIWKRGTQQTISWSNQGTIYPYYPYSSAYSNNGYVRITLNYQCAPGMYCTALYRPPYVIQTSAPNSGLSVWNAGTATLDGSSAVSVPNGTYIVTVCRYDNATVCDSSDSVFTLTD